MSWLKGAINDEKEALEELLQMGADKLLIAGKQLLREAQAELDGLTVTVTITVGRKGT